VNTGIASRALPALLGFELPKALETLMSRLLSIDSIEAVYEKARCGTLLPSLLRELNVTVDTAGADHIPSSGAAVVVSNHPFGLLDGAILAELCLRARRDVKILANDVLSHVPELENLLLPVDVSGGRKNVASVREAIRHLAGGGLLIAFPAGEVSRREEDGPWTPLLARLITLAARRTPELRIIPTFVHGANSKLFRLASVLHSSVQTALLPREMLSKRGSTVRVDIGTPVPSKRVVEIEDDTRRIEYLRWRTYSLRGASQAPEPIRQPVPADLLEREISRLRPECASGDLRAYRATADEIPNTVREICRLREITFRAAGEGTGKAEDTDEFDRHYLHLFIWNSATREIVGAYRICPADQGPSKLYTATLFSFGDAFLNELGPALELGRSFVRPEYQRTFAPLLLLWKAIGRYVAEHPQYKVLFGPVSISNSYSAASRELMVAFLERRSGLRELAGLVKSRNPFRARGMHIPAVVELDDLSAAISDIEGTPAGIPVLLRQYLKLGGRIVAFNVDRAFSHALDGLIVVDLTKTEPKLVERYLGRSEAAAFFEFHRGEHGTNKKHYDAELDIAGHCRRHPAPDTLLQIQRRPRVGLHLLDAWRRTVGQNR